MPEPRRKAFTLSAGLTQVPPGPYADELARKARVTRMQRPSGVSAPAKAAGVASMARAQGVLPMAYSRWAGQNRVEGAVLDTYGNAAGSEYDLIADGAIDGAQVVVLNLCSAEVGLAQPEAALRKKGLTFSAFPGARSWNGTELSEKLADAAELWIISDTSPHLTSDALDVVEDFFHSGRGVYIWGDNEPYYADANLLLQRLFGIRMFGNTPGDQVVSICDATRNVGLIPGHFVTTGIQNVYEGITIAEVPTTEALQPLMYGSNGRVVTAFYDEDGCRAIADGGFTRLYNKWDSAGTARFIVNAAAWLLNMERFDIAS